MAPSNGTTSTPPKLVVTLPSGTLQWHHVLRTLQWHFQSAKVVRRPPPLLEVGTPIAIAIWGNNNNKKLLEKHVVVKTVLFFPLWRRGGCFQRQVAKLQVWLVLHPPALGFISVRWHVALTPIWVVSSKKKHGSKGGMVWQGVPKTLQRSCNPWCPDVPRWSYDYESLLDQEICNICSTTFKEPSFDVSASV